MNAVIAAVGIMLILSLSRVHGVIALIIGALAWAIAIDFLIWNTTPDAYTLGGGCIVILSGLYLIRDERGQAADAAKLAQHP
jgi:predicted histidine transporter YuiF (NhaC family)